MNVLLFCNSVPSVQGFFIPNVPCKPLLSTQNKCIPTCQTLVSPKYATQKHMFATFLRGNNSQCNKEETTGRDTEKNGNKRN